MSYNLAAVRKQMLSQWEGEDYFILKYHPWSSASHDNATTFILDFKDGISEAIKDASDFFIAATRQNAKILKDQYHCKYVMAIPSHSANKANAPCEEVCANIAKATWLIHVPNGLVRIKDVSKSARSSSRPTKQMHMESIKYSGPKTTKNDFSILIIDDVFTLSRTSAACRDIIMRDSGCINVIGMFLGKTQDD